MAEVTVETLHRKMDFLLRDYQVTDLDETALDVESYASLHAKANALCEANGGEPEHMASDTVMQLQPKLDFLLRSHDVEFDTFGFDPSSLDTVDAKLDAIIDAHRTGH